MTAEQVGITADGIDALLAISLSKKFCPLGRTVVCRHRTNRDRHGVFRFGCGAWDCKICGRWKRLKVGRHYAGHLLAEGSPVVEVRCTWDQLPALKRRLQRAGLKWLRVGSQGQSIHVLYCDPAADGKRPDVYATPEAAVERLGFLLRNAHTPRRGQRIRPVGACQEWAMKSGWSAWERVAVGKPVELDPVQQAIAGLNLTPKAHGADGNRQWAVTVSVSLDKVPDLHSALLNALCPPKGDAAGVSHLADGPSGAKDPLSATAKRAGLVEHNPDVRALLPC